MLHPFAVMEGFPCITMAKYKEPYLPGQPALHDEMRTTKDIALYDVLRTVDMTSMHVARHQYTHTGSQLLGGPPPVHVSRLVEPIGPHRASHIQH